MRRLPLYNELWQESLKRDDFTIISVAGDDRGTMPRLRQILKENDVQFPVLHYLDGDEGGQFEYEVGYYGYDMLIDRQGVIVDDIWVREDFIDVIEFLDSHRNDIPRVAIEFTGGQQEDGSFSTVISLTSSNHEPLEAWLGGWYGYYEEGKEREYLFGEEENFSTVQAEYGEFGDYTFELSFPAREGLRRFYLACGLSLEGSEELFDGKGLRIISEIDLSFDEEGNLI